MASFVELYHTVSDYNETSSISTSVESKDAFLTYNISSFVTSLAMTLVCLVGFYGNTVSVIIFSQPSMRSSINILLCGNSVIDLAVLFCAIPVFILPSLDQYLQFRFVPNYYSFSLLVVYPLAMMARTSSVWTFVLISVERYFAICYPFEVNKIITTGRAKVAQITIIALSVFYNIIRFWEYRPNKSTTNLQRTADQVVPLLRANAHYFFIYYTVLYLIANFLAPFFVIIVLNIHILRTMKKAALERRRMNGRRSYQHRTSHMIIVITLLFGMCNICAFVLHIWESGEPNLFDSPNAEKAYLLLDISNVCILFGSSASFIVFLVYCQKYRRFFMWYFCCRCCSTTANFLEAIHYRPVRHSGTDNCRPLFLKVDSNFAVIVEPVNVGMSQRSSDITIE